MRLTDEQIERYSRQLILPEVGPGGQERLGAARVAVVGDGVAAERVVAYLAAAGVGWIAAAPALHRAADVAQTDLQLLALDASDDGAFDVLIVAAPGTTPAAALVDVWRGRSRTTLWIADGIAGGTPPCPRCAATELTTPTTPDELRGVRDALVGTVVATETVKALLAIGVPLAGRVLMYDAETASVTSDAVAARPDCACRAWEP